METARDIATPECSEREMEPTMQRVCARAMTALAADCAWMALRLLLAGGLEIAGIGKIVAPAGLAAYLQELGWPPVLSGGVAALLPSFELTLGICLMARIELELASVLTWLLSAGFVVMALLALSKPTGLGCPCLPQMSPGILSSGLGMVFRNLVLLLAASLAVWKWGIRAAVGGAVPEKLWS
ncbi:MAG TPA: MauE/DoxX family redox-associated membrane protein [Verrucomicrobiae bacterium]|nr:MauE/DoxX family redox-associated membrane protein [Verrucomicrobiae bacterium]